MLRRLFTLASAVSLVLCVAACVLWVRSGGSNFEGVRWERETPRGGGSPLVLIRSVRAFSVTGRLGFEWYWSERVPFPLLNTRVPAVPQPPPVTKSRLFMDRGTPSSSPWPWHVVPHRYTAADGSGAGWTWAGLSFHHFSRQRFAPSPSASWAWGFTAPYWLVVPLAATLPVRWAVLRWQRRRRACAGLCLGCGYDLRATPELCPECGKVPTDEASRV